MDSRTMIMLVWCGNFDHRGDRELPWRFVLFKTTNEGAARKVGLSITERCGRTMAMTDTPVALQERQKRVAKLNIKPLTTSQQTEFADAWEHRTSALRVDDPQAAVANADVLVQEVMNVRGYPVTDFDQRVADVSVDHPAVPLIATRRMTCCSPRTRRFGIEKLREHHSLSRTICRPASRWRIATGQTRVPEQRERIRRAGY